MLLSTASDKTLPAETNRSRTLLWLTIVVALAMEIILTLSSLPVGAAPISGIPMREIGRASRGPSQIFTVL